MTVDVVDSMIDALNEHDLEAVLRFYRADAVAVSPELELGNSDEIGSFFTQLWEGFPNIHFELLEKIAQDDVITATMMASGTNTGPYLTFAGEVLPPTGRKVAIRACCWWRLTDGLIASQSLYYDQLEIYAQLGIRLTFADGLRLD
jgi:steroid delta-isomerase-like uncharacterized protein